MFQLLIKASELLWKVLDSLFHLDWDSSLRSIQLGPSVGFSSSYQLVSVYNLPTELVGSERLLGGLGKPSRMKAGKSNKDCKRGNGFALCT